MAWRWLALLQSDAQCCANARTGFSHNCSIHVTLSRMLDNHLSIGEGHMMQGRAALMRIIASCCAVAAFAGAISCRDVSAQTRIPTQLETLLSCRQIAETSARLACFDRTSGDLDAARSAGRIAVVDRETARAQGQRGFGLSGARIQKPAEENLATPSEIKSTVRTFRASTLSPGRWDLFLANGMAWQSVEPPRRLPRIGQAITITRVRLGGYRANVDGADRSFLVKRLR